MRGFRVLAALCLLTLSTSNVYFEIPFNLHQYTLTAVLVDSSVHLRVHDVVNVSSQVCNASTPSTQASRIDFHVAAPSDRLVAVDMHAISVKSFEEIADAAAGTAHVLPLFDDPDDGDEEARKLSGFVRLTVVHPSFVTFEPTQVRRSTAVHSSHADSPFDNVAVDDPDDALRFRISFADLVARRGRVEAVYVQGAEAVHLRVASVDGAHSGAESNALDVAATDRLVAADMIPITLQQLDVLLEGEPGTSALLPLVDNEGHGNHLSGFILVEILHATTLVFEPVEPSRVAALGQVAARYPSHPFIQVRDASEFAAHESSPATASPSSGGSNSSFTRPPPAAIGASQRPKADIYQLPPVVDIAQDEDDETPRTDDQGNVAMPSHDSDGSLLPPSDVAAALQSPVGVENTRQPLTSATTASDDMAKSAPSVGDAELGDNVQKSVGDVAPSNDSSGPHRVQNPNDPTFITPVRVDDSHPTTDGPSTVSEATSALPAQSLSVTEQRKLGLAFEFDVVFPTKTRLGISWDADVADRTEIDSIEPHSPAAALACLERRDHLIAINGVNVSSFGPPDVVPVYVTSKWPKTLRFRVGPTKAEAPPPPAPVNTTVPAPSPPLEPRRHDFPLTSHADIPRLRRQGEGFWYEVTLPDMQTPIGIYWDLHTAASRTIVHAIEPGSVAHRLGVIQKGDQLLLVNEANVTALGPRDALAQYKATQPPRTLLLYSRQIEVEQPTASSSAAPQSASTLGTPNPAPNEQSDAVPSEDPDVLARREQWQLVPPSTVRSKRQAREVVQYEIQVTAPGPIGIVWDRQMSSKTVVKAVDSQCRFSTVAVRDQLIGINDKNVSGLGPQQVVVFYTQASFPKRLVFRTAVDSNARDEAAIAEPQITRLVVQTPPVLKDWVLPLDVADWSASMATTNVTLVAASPVSSCFKQTLPQVALGDVTIVVAIRGGCAFTDKAHHVLNAQGDGLVLASNVAGPGKFPQNMPHVDPLSLPVAMISRDDGEVLLAVLAYEYASATWQQLPKSKAPPPPTPLPPDHSNPSSELAAALLWHIEADGSASTMSLDYVAAAFGKAVGASQPFQVVYSTPFQTACHRDDVTVRGKGSVVVVRHGACSFAKKAKVVQQLGAQGMIVVSADDAPVVLASEDADISLWAVSIGRRDGDRLQQVLASSLSVNSPVLLRFLPRVQDTPAVAT